MIRKVGIVSKPGRADTAELLARLLPWLDKHGVAHRLDRVVAPALDPLVGARHRLRLARQRDQRREQAKE